MFKLVRTDEDSNSTTLSPGNHEFGRRVFLDCKDKRVSHRHGQLSVGEDNKIILTALHQNPCFVIVKNSPGLIVMREGMTRVLEEGDEFGLLPDAYWYRLTKNGDNGDECKNEPVQKSSTKCEEKTKVVIEILDFSSLGTDVAKEQNSTAEITDEDTPSQPTSTSHSPHKDVLPEQPSSSTKQMTLSTESLHIDDEPKSEMSGTKNVYNPQLWNTALTQNLSPDRALDAEDSEWDFDYDLSPIASPAELLGAVDKSEANGPLESAQAVALEDWRNVPGQSGVKQRREADEDSLDSDVSDSDSDYVEEPVTELELGTLDDEQAPCVADSDSADNEPFVWHDITEFAGRRETFTPNAGPTRSFPDPYSAFTAIWDESIMDHICRETNRYFVQEMEKCVRAEHSRTKYWKDTTVHEMYTFFAIILLMGITQMPSVECYFSCNQLLYHPAFGHIMSKHRYRLLSAFFHLANNEDLVETYEGDRKLFKAQPIIDHCNKKFKELYVPTQNVSIDESLTLWKGRLSWKQMNVSKAAKFGIKTFELCESATGYLWSFIVYTGKNTVSALTEIVPEGATKSTEVVLTLIEPLLNQGYTVWMDNWFNSPFLARFLKIRRTDCAGTLRACRKDVPTEIRHHALSENETFGLASKFCAVFAWLDRRRVSVISTFHKNQMVEVRRSGRRVVTKPHAVQDYNMYMGGVDKKDQMLHSFLIERKRGRKWYVKFFKRLLNNSTLNAKILFEASTNCQISHVKFRLNLIDSLLKRHLEQARPHLPPSPSLSRKRSRSNVPLNRQQADDAHELIPVEPRKACVVCSRQGRGRKMTNYRCNLCDAPLCVHPCFTNFHHSDEFDNFFHIGTKRRRKV